MLISLSTFIQNRLTGLHINLQSFSEHTISFVFCRLHRMAEVRVKLKILKSSEKDEEEAMDKETAAYLQQAKQEQHNILYLNYKHLQYIPSALVANEDFRCIKQLYLRNNCLEKLVSGCIKCNRST